MNRQDGFLSFSDTHCEPSQRLPPAAYVVARKARELRVPLILNGDILDLVLWGKDAYQASPAVKDIIGWAYLQDVHFVVGNHEGLIGWVRELFRDSDVHVVKCWDCRVNGVLWHAEHGDRYSLDWGHFKWLFVGLAEVMLRVAPKAWLRFCKRWRPGPIKPPPGKESERYNVLTGTIWHNAMADALRRDVDVTLGHTHTTIPARLSWMTGMILDGGDCRDGSYVSVGPDGIGSIGWTTAPTLKGRIP